MIHTAAPRDTTSRPNASTLCGDYGKDMGEQLTGNDGVGAPGRGTTLPATEFSRRRGIIYAAQDPTANCGCERLPQVLAVPLGPTPKTEAQQPRDSPAAALSHTARRCSASPTPGQLEIQSEEVVGEKKGARSTVINPDRGACAATAPRFRAIAEPTTRIWGKKGDKALPERTHV